jgi:hypothetical protein
MVGREGRTPVTRAFVALLLVGLCQLVPQAASAAVILDLNFENVSGLATAASERSIQEILASTPGELPPGISFGTPVNVESAINVRRADNLINGPWPNGFAGFFTSQFLVLGAEQGSTDIDNHPPRLGQYDLTFALAIPLDATSLDISYDFVVDGAVHAGSNQYFVTYLSQPGVSGGYTVQALTTHSDPALFGGQRGHVSLTIPMADVLFAPMQFTISLSEFSTNPFSNIAAGVDNLLITTNGSAVPEPATLWLFVAGLACVAPLIRTPARVAIDCRR